MKVPDIKGLTSSYPLLAAYILPEQQTNLRINPDDAENLLIMFKMFDTPTDLWKLKKRAEPAQLVDISKLDLNSKIKKFSYSFICGKGYSPPFGGE